VRRLLAAIALLVLALPAAAADATKGHGITVFDQLKYPPDFKQLDYVEPNAPKGGTVKLATIGTFDTFNPFVLRGSAAIGIGGVFDTLMSRVEDEVSTLYCLVCESVERSADRKLLTFTLRPEARFHDGSPVTVDDVIWSYETLRTKGHPRYRALLNDVEKPEKLDERVVRFTVKDPENREAPLGIGELPILSKAYWANRDFEKTTLDPPLGSGPYKIDTFEAGRSISYARVKDYWAKDLPIKRGTDNFDVIRYDYYRDMGISLEALKAGQFDYREEFTSKDWATGYDVDAVKHGRLIRKVIKHQIPQGMQAMVFNLRKPLFQDARVRRAIGYAFDFEWINKNLMYGSYFRTKSWFSNSEYAASGLPTGKELELLEPLRGKIPDEVFTAEYRPPTYDGSGNIREGLREAIALLKQAGWSFKGKQLVNDKTGEPFVFEYLNAEARSERILLPFKANLERLGITMNLRNVDPTQFQNRVRDFDFDMVTMRWPGSFPPGNEMREFVGSEAAKAKGSYNYAGIADPTIDALVEKVTNAHAKEDLVAAAHALDRVLMQGHYLIPEWHHPEFWIAYWNKFGQPGKTPPYSVGFDTWWIDPAKEAALAQGGDGQPQKTQ
jgi:microcin C transport system substrate-binding protein